MLNVRIADDIEMLCPHCGATIEELLARRIRHDLGKAYAHACPRCRKLVGITHRKGFWMG
jgi:hypothetical protein